MLWAWETTARYLFKGCHRVVLTIPMSQSVSDIVSLKAYRQGHQIVVEGIFIPCQESDTCRPQQTYEASAEPKSPSPLLTSVPCLPVSEKRVLS
jgi:hypothetical protein